MVITNKNWVSELCSSLPFFIFFLHSSFFIFFNSFNQSHEQFVGRTCCSSLLGHSSISLLTKMLHALSYLKINHVESKPSSNPIPMLHTLKIAKSTTIGNGSNMMQMHTYRHTFPLKETDDPCIPSQTTIQGR